MSPKKKSKGKKSSRKSASKSSKGSPKFKAPKALENMNPTVKKLLFGVGLWVLVFVVSLVIVDYAVQYYNYKASVAIVDGERISKGEFYEKLEETYGEAVINEMIEETIVFHEAEKEGIEVTDEKVDDEVSQLEQEYGGEEGLKSQLEMRGLTMDDLKRNIKISLMLEELLKDDVQITEEDKQEYYEQNKANLIPGNEEPTYEEAEEIIVDRLTQEKISLQVTPWIMEKRDELDIKNNIENPRDYKLLGITRDLVSNLWDDVTSGDSDSK